MTCDDVAELLDAFVDAELPAQTLLAVARHAGTCATCDAAVRELSSLHDAVERSTRAAADALDLSRVWPAVDARIARVEARRAWTRRVRTLPAFTVGLAAAAAAVLWFRAPVSEPARVATRTRPNQAVFERIDSGGARFELRRERKNGTTLIMVSADAAEAPR